MSVTVVVLSMLALSHAESVVPVKTSHVDVRRSGGEFSYNIQENQGVASVDSHIPILQPQVRAVQITNKFGPIDQHSNEGQTSTSSDTSIKSHTDTKEGHGELAIIPQPIIPYTYYYPYAPYPIHQVAKSHILPYPYTLINTL
ncbi:uncharacterized protein LOC143202341 isoform X2 [Rhynchophorus ferrugineus]|uniref:uncharacterized protein LOC143202341 isoform X2 n=1 Tax=Rhynchophorus ferrugineus TaxID=354439 RepID=UPI003FCE43A1